MKILLIIACLFFYTNVYADQAKDDSSAQVQQEASEIPTDWVNTDEKPRFTDDESGEPISGDNEQPSFQPDPE